MNNQGFFGFKNLTVGRVGAILLASAVLILMLFLPIIPPSLVVASNKEVIYEKVVDSLYCEVDFRHSVNKGYIREVYKIDKGTLKLNLEKGYFQSYGAGMLDIAEITNGMNFRQEGDYFVLDFPVNWQENIGYIGGNIAEHKFIYNNDIIEIGKNRPQKPFTLSVKKRSIINKLLKRV